MSDKVCRDCRGSGRDKFGPDMKCPTCMGSGSHPTPLPDVAGDVERSLQFADDRKDSTIPKDIALNVLASAYRSLLKRVEPDRPPDWIKGVRNPDAVEWWYNKLISPLREFARGKGYAIAVHGSLRRDIDLVAIPWTESSIDPQKFVDELLVKFDWILCNGVNPEQKPNGRLAWNICSIREFRSTFIDLSITPSLSILSARTEELTKAREEITALQETRWSYLDALESAWGIIANSYGGDWTNGSPDWKKSAAKWRDEWMKIIGDHKRYKKMTAISTNDGRKG